MDGVLTDIPLIRLALPAAPLALGEDDPFHFAEVGRAGTDILTRPLDRPGSVSPSFARPLHCEEPAPGHQLAGRPRVHIRALSWDGEMLVTFSTGPVGTISNASIVHLWNLRPHGRVGAANPQRQGSVVIPARALWYPIAITANAAIVATQFEERAMRLYDLRANQFLELPTGPIAPEAKCALSPDGALMALFAPDLHRVELWGTAARQRLQVWTPNAPVTALSFAAAGSRPTLAIGYIDGVCEVYAAG
jgi:hypothetical protein